VTRTYKSANEEIIYRNNRNRPPNNERKRIVEEFISDTRNNTRKIVYDILWRRFYERGLHIKDGATHKLYYDPHRRFCDEGVSSYSKRGYYFIVLKQFDYKHKICFFYRGVYLIYYDPYKWAYRDDNLLRIG